MFAPYEAFFVQICDFTLVRPIFLSIIKLTHNETIYFSSYLYLDGLAMSGSIPLPFFLYGISSTYLSST